MNVLHAWWNRSTPEQKKVLAELTGSTVAALHQAAHAYRSAGSLRITPDFAARIEKASGQIEGLPVLRREDLSPTCGACDYARGCRE